MTPKNMSNILMDHIKSFIDFFPEKKMKKNAIKVKDSYEAVAYLINAYMLNLGFKLIGFGETHDLDVPITSFEIKPFPDIWIHSKEPFYAFKYSFHDKDDIFIVKLLKMGEKMVILGTKFGNDDTVLCNLSIDHYIQKDFFPYPNESENRLLEDAFISDTKIIELVEIYKTNILEKLIYNLNYPCFIKESSCGKIPFQTLKHEESSQFYNIPVISEFNSQKTDIPVMHPSPFSIGHDDLCPPGIRNRPSISPYIGEDISLDKFNGCINGMYPNRNHPLYSRFSKNTSSGRMIVPPGARYDPVMPNDSYNIGPGYLNNSFKFRNPGEPDNDEFLPPGVDSMVMFEKNCVK
ncbi:hypothetical protein PCANB_001561 [Pneumocystis canis]|nr:hypothetical protein PCANB_001561 [Pneumocystis canis]